MDKNGQKSSLGKQIWHILPGEILNAEYICFLNMPNEYMSELTFETAARKVKTLTSSPTNDEKLALYGLFKQATIGDCNTSQPWAVQVTGRAKWDAWVAYKGKRVDDSKKEYVKLVETLIYKYGIE